METEPQINFLENPHINANSIPDLDPVQVYVNLFNIKLTKNLQMFEYSYEIAPQIPDGANQILQDIFKFPSRELKAKYGLFFISGNAFYSSKKIDEITLVKSRLNNKNDCTITISKCIKEKMIKDEDFRKNKNLIELIIKDILLANPNIERFEDTYILDNTVQKINSFDFYQGYKISMIETDAGNLLNVVPTHKLIRRESILQYLGKYSNYKNDKAVQKEINNKLKGLSFKVCYAKRHYIIDEILFGRNPSNTTINYGGKSINLVEYYKIVYKKDIKKENQDQPLILVIKKLNNDEQKNIYFVPEFCNLINIGEEDVNNSDILLNISKYTKLNPKEKVKRINDFLNLLKDSTVNKTLDNMSSKKKYDYYGIEIIPKNLIQAYYMKETELTADQNKVIDIKKYSKGKDSVNLLQKTNFIKWVLFYENNKDNNEGYIIQKLNMASNKYGLKLDIPLKIEMPYNVSAHQWIKEANEYFGNEKREYDFALFLLGNNANILYPKLKVHSLCTNGYISQVVKVDTLWRGDEDKTIMGICSKILLQINAKIGGAAYTIKKSEPIKNKKIMIIGVDSSKYRDKNIYGTGVAMVASINNLFTDFYNKVSVIKRENTENNTEENTYQEQFHFCISEFINEAVEVYKKNNGNQQPDWIIIYRQGVSLQQKEFLKGEIREINNTCKNKNILYYYILVNTKSTFKFFEQGADNSGKKTYFNPYSGLLVLDEVINRNFFEFYIQPQEVTQGSATPTCFQVAYGNLNFPEFIPKFTFDLCHIYSNWQGSIRIPNVIKCSEKLAKMAAKYKFAELNDNIKRGQAYL